MESNLLASGLGFPEGPTVLGDGRIVLCDGNTGELLAYQDGNMSLFASTGGAPRGTHLGPDNKLYLNQGGDVPRNGDLTAVPGVPPAGLGGAVEFLLSEVGGDPRVGPKHA